MLKSLSIRAKLGILIIIPVIAALIITLIGVYYVNKISENLTKSVYDEGFQSISLVLNADRDAYQALDNMNAILIKNSAGTLDPAAKDELLASFDENTGQTNDRVKEAFDILSKNKDVWDNYKDEAFGMTVFEHYDAFAEDYTKWLEMANQVKNTYAPGEDYVTIFDSAREHMNSIGELVEMGVQQSITDSEAQKNTMIVTMIIIDVIVLALIIALSILLIRAITGPLKKSVFMLQEMVKGRLNRRLNLKQRDEIGILGNTLDQFAD
ncbi:MAG TPA: HAMP domain-containing protein, partial [Anaerovoracaceae bacterium]|nr:HAMP domain-containing protein [Anaerovoracaceae bacterium]